MSESSERVYDFICQYLDQHGWAPTIREIGAGVGFSSPSTVHGHLRRLEAHGRIVLGGGPRMIRVVRTWPVRSVLGFDSYLEGAPGAPKFGVEVGGTRPPPRPPSFHSE